MWLLLERLKRSILQLLHWLVVDTLAYSATFVMIHATYEKGLTRASALRFIASSVYEEV
jgi:hypothetical protein